MSREYLLRAADETFADPTQHSLLTEMSAEGLVAMDEWAPAPLALPSDEIYFMLACFVLLYLEKEF